MTKALELTYTIDESKLASDIIKAVKKYSIKVTTAKATALLVATKLGLTNPMLIANLPVIIKNLLDKGLV